MICETARRAAVDRRLRSSAKCARGSRGAWSGHVFAARAGRCGRRPALGPLVGLLEGPQLPPQPMDFALLRVVGADAILAAAGGAGRGGRRGGRGCTSGLRRKYVGRTRRLQRAGARSLHVTAAESRVRPWRSLLACNTSALGRLELLRLLPERIPVEVVVDRRNWRRLGRPRPCRGLPTRRQLRARSYARGRARGHRGRCCGARALW